MSPQSACTHRRFSIRPCYLLLAIAAGVPTARAQVYGGFDFPQGPASFADTVIGSLRGPPASDTSNINPAGALGVPNDLGQGHATNCFSLGTGGWIEVGFTDNLLVNGAAGPAGADCLVFEPGFQGEAVDIAVRPTPATLALLNPAMDLNGDGFFELTPPIGQAHFVRLQDSHAILVDVDATFVGFAPGILTFDAVRIEDVASDFPCCEPYGADIDAVGAIGIPSPATPFCYGDGSLPTACPCAPPAMVPSPSAAEGHGCANSLNLDGALLTATGSTSPDTVTMSVYVASNYIGFGFLVKGDASTAGGIADSDGVRCVSGQLVRFGGHAAGTNGTAVGYWAYPNTAQTTHVTTATAQSPGQAAYYQLFYRNAAEDFCSPATANWSNGVRIAW